jgi:hypothetical protein
LASGYNRDVKLDALPWRKLSIPCARDGAHMHELVETVVAFQYSPAVLGFPKLHYALHLSSTRQVARR